jgi:hypothetical protein
MADPLTAVADRFAPPQTNFFDPAAGQNVISRYANARIGQEASEALAGSAERLYRLRDDEQRRKFDEEQQARERLTWTREDEDYEARKEAESSRVELFRAFNQIDATAPDYTERLAEFVTGLPSALVEDEALRVAIQAKNADADDARRAVETGKTREHQLAMANERLKASGLKAGVTPEQLAKYTLPDGTIDPMFYYEAGKTEREAKGAEWDRRQKAIQEGRIKATKPEDLSKKTREQRPTFKTMVEDKGAFPSQVDVFLKASGEKDIETAALDNEEGLRQAKAWDAKKFDNELMTAYGYDNAEDYVNAGEDKNPGATKLTEKQRDLRRRFWKHAQESIEEDEAPETKAESAPKGGKPLDVETAKKFKDQAKGDRAEAERLAREAGYSW